MEQLPTYLFTQGVLGVVVLVLASVVIYLYKKIERQQTRIEQLQELRLQDSKEVTRDVTEVLQGNAQSNLILAEKIEVAKSGRS